jgi:DNA-directed RNA polymerase specialized sigma24 family protein
MDVLVDAYALLDLGSRCSPEQVVRRAAREVSRQHKRLMRLGQHEVGLEVADHLAREHSRLQRQRELLWEWLDGLLAQLTPKERAVIERHLDGAPDRAIATEEGGTASSIRTLRYKAMLKLKALAGSSPPPRVTFHGEPEPSARCGAVWLGLVT